MAYGEVTDDTADKSSGPDGTYTDDDLLSIVSAEMRRSIGFENDAELTADRTRALQYLKGDMTKDVPSLPNRSKAVSSDIADAVETILPDLMEIFTGGSDVVAFIPNGPEDEKQAEQETNYLSQVVWQDNPGFLSFYSAIKDALTLKICVFKFWWEDSKKVSEEKFTGKSPVEMALAGQNGELVDVSSDGGEPEEAQDLRTAPAPTYSFTVRKTKDLSRAKYQAFPPDDFTVAPDTVRVTDATYCAMRSRPRVQDLIADGYDPESVRSLPPYAVDVDTVQQARDTAGEHTDSNTQDETNDDLRQVQIVEHYIRLLGPDNQLKIYCVVTDADAKVYVTKGGKKRWEEECIPFAVGSPYLVAHRLYGESLADKLFEVQRIKTALTRALLDSAYFALNQRMEVATGPGRAGDYTISDLLRNEPGVPIRSVDGDSVKPINSAGLSFDAYSALEFFSTVSEQRTGVVRNAQGLNPDTLHDTAKGAMALMAAAQRRTRMIARILAETCIKELYLGIHALIRENSTATVQAKFNNQWVAVDPTKWAERNNMTIEVGLGASGRDADLQAYTVISQDMMAIVENGGMGTIVTPENIYNLASDKAKALNRKQPQRYYTDPASLPPQPPKPDPEMIKVQGDQQLQQQKMQGEMQLGQLKVQSEKEIQANKAQSQAAVNAQQQQLEHERLQAQQANEMALEQIKIASAERIAIEVARINAEAKIEAARISAKNQTDDGAAALAYQEAHETTA